MEDSIISRQVGQDRMVYDPDTDSVHILNPTARLILEAHGRGQDEAAIAAQLRETFRLPAEHPVLEDVKGCLEALRKAGLLKG